jgi:hypothetical protein
VKSCLFRVPLYGEGIVFVSGYSRLILTLSRSLNLINILVGNDLVNCKWPGCIRTVCLFVSVVLQPSAGCGLLVHEVS